MGRTTTPGWSTGTSSIDRPLCLGASGSVRASTKIQLAVGPAEVQIFCPLITHSARSRTALVRTDGGPNPPVPEKP